MTALYIVTGVKIAGGSTSVISARQDGFQGPQQVRCVVQQFSSSGLTWAGGGSITHQPCGWHKGVTFLFFHVLIRIDHPYRTEESCQKSTSKTQISVYVHFKVTMLTNTMKEKIKSKYKETRGRS